MLKKARSDCPIRRKVGMMTCIFVVWTVWDAGLMVRIPGLHAEMHGVVCFNREYPQL